MITISSKIFNLYFIVFFKIKNTPWLIYSIHNQ